MSTYAKRVYEWAALKANQRFAPFWLGCIFALELVLFLPLDAILVLFCLENPSRRYLYAAIATLVSVISGTIGFMLGLLAWDVIGPYVIDHMISASFFDRLSMHYHQYQNWAVMLGSFLPLPFKAVSLSAGVCQLAFIPFAACVFLARLTRFFLVAKAVQKWGVQIKGFIERYFGRVLLAVGAKVAIALTFFWVLGQ